MALIIKYNLLPKIKLVIRYFSRMSASFYIENSVQCQFTQYTSHSVFMGFMDMEYSMIPLETQQHSHQVLTRVHTEHSHLGLGANNRPSTICLFILEPNIKDMYFSTSYFNFLYEKYYVH